MSSTPNLNGLQTESRNPRSTEIDNVSTLELCQIINNEDATIPSIIKNCIPTIANAIDALAPRVQAGGRVFYTGAGTSGRLGVLDASEIPPTFSAPPSQFVGLIAGGDVALRSAKEGAEDSLQGAVDDLTPYELDGEKDALIGVASSGRTPYVLSSLAFAKSKGCVTIGISCAAPSEMSRGGNVDFMIEAVTGPEIVTGSTRMKAGTATKLILNMLSTGTMIKVGKTFGNIMIDVKPTNIKLKIRARRILREICGDRCPALDEDIDQELRNCGRSVKLAAVKISLGVSVEEAERLLKDAGGVLANLLKPQASILSLANGIAEGSYVLCVDGGGSKCNAVIISENGDVGSGESGPGNPSDIGIQEAISAMELAIQEAVNSCDTTRGRNIRDLHITNAWVGLAGADRKDVGTRIRIELEKLLGQQEEMRLSVTNDIELLATASGHQFKSDDVIILIAGTGSIAMRYRRIDGEFQRIGRSGGWGALLGDDGSGFDIGRKAIRAALQQTEDEAYPATSDPDSLDSLPNIISNHFSPAATDTSNVDLLSSVLSSTHGEAQSASHTKRRIASCARVVIDAVQDSKQAETIVSDAVDSLMALVRKVYRMSVVIDGSNPLLVLAGGLIKSEAIVHHLVVRLNEAGIEFSQVERVHDPVSIGAQFLAQKR